MAFRYSRRIHRYGHCCSYTVLEELETESALAASKQTDVCPEDIIRTSNLCTGLAWNNFDRFVDTTIQLVMKLVIVMKNHTLTILLIFVAICRLMMRTLGIRMHLFQAQMKKKT